MRKWISLLLAVLLVLGAGLSTAFCALYDPMARDLAAASEAAGEKDWKQAAQLVKSAAQDWKNARNFTAAFADHEPLEEMDSLFARLLSLSPEDDPSEFTAACAQLSCLAQAMADSQRLSWWNFF